MNDPLSHQPCTHDGCADPCLPFTQPPLCQVHVPDPHSWYEDALSQLRPSPASEPADAPLGLFLQGLYRYALVGRGLPGQIYGEYEQRRKAGGKIAFSFTDITFFIVEAASACILSGLAYDAIKAMIRRIVPSSGQREEALGVLPWIISEARYQELSAEQQQLVIESEEVVEVRLRRTFRLVMRVVPNEDQE